MSIKKKLKHKSALRKLKSSFGSISVKPKPIIDSYGEKGTRTTIKKGGSVSSEVPPMVDSDKMKDDLKLKRPNKKKGK